MESQEEKHFTAWNTTPKSSGFYITIAGKLCCLLCQIWAECIKCRGGCSHSQQCLSSVGVPGGSGVKNLLPAMQEIQVWPLGQESPLEKETATHSSILAWKTPWTEAPSRWHATQSQRVGHNSATKATTVFVQRSAWAHLLFAPTSTWHQVHQQFPKAVCALTDFWHSRSKRL